MSHISFIKNLLAFIGALAICAYIYLNWDELSVRISRIDAQLIVVVFLLYVTFSLLSSYQIRSSTKHNSPIHIGVMVSSLSTVAGSILPSGASPTRFILLKESLKLNTVEAMSSLFRTVNSGLIVNSIIALSLIPTLNLNQLSTPDVQTFLFILASASGVILLVNLALVLLPIQTLQKFWTFSSHFSAFRFLSIKQFSCMAILSILQMLVLALVLSMLGVNLGSANNFGVYLLLAAINNLTMVIAITPGNIGLREGIYILIAPQLGFEYQDLVAISLIDRAVQFLSFLSIGLITLAVYKFTKSRSK